MTFPALPLCFQPLFIFPSLGLPELSIIVVLVLILFGPGKLPGVMKALGDGVRQFKSASNGELPADSAKNRENTAEKPE